MSVIKQNFVTLSGPLDKMDDFISFLAKNSSFIIDAPPDSLRTMQRAVQSNDINPYVALQSKLNSLADIAKNSLSNTQENYDNYGTLKLEDAEQFDDFFEKNKTRLNDLYDSCQNLKDNISKNEKTLEQLIHFNKMNFELKDLFDLQFIKVRFGSLPQANYDRLKAYLGSMKDLIFTATSVYKEKVWGIYFVTAQKQREIDSLMESLGFEITIIPKAYSGNPADSIDKLTKNLAYDKEQLKNSISNLASFANALLIMLEDCKDEIKRRSFAFETKRNTICSDEGFTIYGWISKKELEAFRQNISVFADVTVMVQHPEDVSNKPPVVLKNSWFFRPFQNYVEMYGTPSYNELDPTVVVSLTYCLFFGIMFGDIGQGAVLILGGFIMNRFMKMWLGQIIERVGIFSIIFGFVYGSVFGNEELLPGFKPNHNISTVLFLAVALGAVMIVICGILNIVNGIKQKNLEKAIFSPNGLVGVTLYIVALVVVLAIMEIATFAIPMGVLITVIVICLLLLFLREPIVGIITKDKEKIPKNIGEFFALNFFELFEVLLSYVTNTISFIRVGAFALSHAGMMTVVYLLASTSTGSHNPVILIIGNLLVIALEGLIVGIQNLRLEFYELFSRFYDGNGKPAPKN